MKICKVDKRWKTFRQNGFELVLRFDRWGTNSSKVEKWLKENYNTHPYDEKGPFYGKFGTTRHWNHSRPYFIGIRQSAIVSALLLCVQLNENDH